MLKMHKVGFFVIDDTFDQWRVQHQTEDVFSFFVVGEAVKSTGYGLAIQ
jgi:hypothetical protein